MKEIMKENMETFRDILNDIGSGIWSAVKGIAKAAYMILIFWCAIWVALGRILWKAFEDFCDWTAKRERIRHYGKGV